MRQIVYFSTAAGRQDAITTAAIVAVSRNNNRAGQITGLLVASGHRYLQVIEGPIAAVDKLTRRLRADDRHLGMTVLIDRSVSERSFDGWSMAFAEAPDLDHFATLADLAGIMWGVVSDGRLRHQIDCFVRTFATPPRRATLVVDGSH